MSRHGSLNGGPPVAPKPGGKVLVYVYEAPGTTGSLQNGQLPPNAQLIRSAAGAPQYVNRPEEQYPYSEECLEQDARSRLKRRAKKAGKGYKVLADVTPSSAVRNSSKGGKMFMKQKKRMEEYTSSNEDAGEYRQHNPLKINYGRMEDEYSSFNKGKQSSDIPSALLKTLTKERKKKQAIQRLRSPPPEWRAKVDSDYPLYDESRNPSNKRWNTTDTTYSSRPPRSKSTPPGSWKQYNGTQDDENRYPARSVNEKRPGSSSGVVMVNFDARNRKRNPQWDQEYEGKETFPAKHHVEHDFNARATGWSRAYVQQY